MEDWHRRQQARTDKIIKARFKTALMSNAKWVKVLTVLTGTDLGLSACALKLVWDSALRTLQLEHRVFGYDYYEHALEGMVTGYPRGWYAYKEFEWLQISAPKPGLRLDLDLVERSLRQIGVLELERLPGPSATLRLLAYSDKTKT